MIDEKKLIEDILWRVREQNIISEEVSHNRSFCDKANVIECINNQPKIGEWILCRKQLPDKMGYYIATYILADDPECIRCYELFYNKQFNEWFYPMEKRVKVKGNVIAWQFLPEPYKEV